MSSKIKIVYPRAISSFGSEWLAPLMNQYFDFELWDPAKTYDRGTLFYLNCLDFPEHNNVLPATPAQLTERGFRVIVDNLWEIHPGRIEHAHIVNSLAWFWYNESLWYTHRGYDTYRPEPNPSHLALMPMRLRRQHRSEFLGYMSHLLDKMIWSYVDLGLQLPNDVDLSDWRGQRHFNPDWYNQTYLSLVVETRVDPGRYHPTFLTEKTFKPLAYYHPVIIYGNRRSLALLRSLGFETFDNLWDESYDNIVNYEQRRDAIIKLLETIEIRPHDAETLAKLEHNHHHFFDTELVTRNIIKEIIEPIIEYATSTSI